MQKRNAGEQMGDMTVSMDTERTAVWIFALHPVPEDAIGAILLGLEEEGIPAEVGIVSGGSAESIAKQAADGSRLNVGIGIDGTGQTVVLHHRDLTADSPLFTLAADEYHRTHMRRLGVNAARLVKGNPLIFHNGHDDGVASGGAADRPHHQPDNKDQLRQDQLEELVFKVVAEILNNTQQ
jgi:hypothetical protein